MMKNDWVVGRLLSCLWGFGVWGWGMEYAGICVQWLGPREQGSPAGNPDTHFSRFSQCQGLEIFLNPPTQKSFYFCLRTFLLVDCSEVLCGSKKIPQCSYHLTGSIFSWWNLKSSQFFSLLIP